MLRSLVLDMKVAWRSNTKEGLQKNGVIFPRHTFSLNMVLGISVFEIIFWLHSEQVQRNAL